MSASPGRAEQRLEIARRLLKLPEGANVMQHINAMPPVEREELRGLVDWVEEYENYEIHRPQRPTKTPECDMFNTPML